MKKRLEDLPEVCTLQTLVDSGIVEVSVSTVRNWCLSGEYPNAKKLGKSWFVNPRDFVDWVRGNMARAK